VPDASQPPTGAATFRSLSHQLSALAELASSAGFWRDVDPSRSVASYSVVLVKSLFMIDNDFSMRDHGFVNDVFQAGNSFEANLAIARRTHARSGRTFAYDVPPFFVGIAAMDKAQRTQYAVRALQLIRAMIFTAATAESDFTGEEADFLTTHISVLGRHLIEAGVATESVVVDAGMKAALLRDLELKDKAAWSRPARYEGDVVDDAAPVPEVGPSLADLMAQLTNLVGLEAVKHEVTTMSNQIRIRQMRVQRGLPVPPMSNHLVFSGNPGTGKTTVARILASIYRAIGALKKGHLVETDRSGLVASYVGHTGPRVKEVVDRARGGVLFIDEAYALTEERSEGDFGTEAVDTLLKLMEDHRDDLIVIVAGYDGKMAMFLSSNPGLKSRFNKFIRFPDYTPAELVDIFRRMASSNKYELTDTAVDKVTQILSTAHASRDETFGNARLVRNLFEQSLALQANRLAAFANPSTEALCLLVADDVPSDPVLH
jgi:Holliday junction resolvasome RuvABC ATP-dependent DNA helicase subunit